jgi:hypothetical protein
MSPIANRQRQFLLPVVFGRSSLHFDFCPSMLPLALPKVGRSFRMLGGGNFPMMRELGL